jgi:hypothetical protein
MNQHGYMDCSVCKEGYTGFDCNACNDQCPDGAWNCSTACLRNCGTIYSLPFDGQRKIEFSKGFSGCRLCTATDTECTGCGPGRCWGPITQTCGKQPCSDGLAGGSSDSQLRHLYAPAPTYASPPSTHQPVH